MKQRIKLCEVCKIDFSKNPKEWVFVCKECLVAVKKDNTAYKYGGTWKK
jgi:hypothetical protein